MLIDVNWIQSARNPPAGYRTGVSSVKTANLQTLVILARAVLGLS
jgi:hypothetical protein